VTHFPQAARGSKHQVHLSLRNGRKGVGKCSYLHELYKLHAIRVNVEIAQVVFNMDTFRLGSFKVFVQGPAQDRRDPATEGLHKCLNVLMTVKSRLKTYWDGMLCLDATPMCEIDFPNFRCATFKLLDTS